MGWLEASVSFIRNEFLIPYNPIWFIPSAACEFFRGRIDTATPLMHVRRRRIVDTQRTMPGTPIYRVVS